MPSVYLSRKVLNALEKKRELLTSELNIDVSHSDTVLYLLQTPGGR